MSKIRNTGTIIVQREFYGDGPSSWSDDAGGAAFDSVPDAKKWIRNNGEEGCSYRIIRYVVVKKYTCTVHHITKRTLV